MAKKKAIRASSNGNGPPTGQGHLVTVRPPHAKQITGVPVSQAVALLPVTLPEGASWVKNPLGLPVGVLVTKKGTIGFCPVALPSMKIKKFELIVDFFAEGEGALLDFNFLYFNKLAQPCGIKPTGPYVCSGVQTASVELPEGTSPDRILTSGLEADVGPFEIEGDAATTGGKPVIIRAVRLECHG